MLSDHAKSLSLLSDSFGTASAAGETGASSGSNIPANWDSPRPTYLILYRVELAQASTQGKAL